MGSIDPFASSAPFFTFVSLVAFVRFALLVSFWMGKDATLDTIALSIIFGRGGVVVPFESPRSRKSGSYKKDHFRIFRKQENDTNLTRYS